MSALSPKLRKIGHNTIAFWCQGCSTAHGVNIGRNGWLWNEDPNSPTFTPSVLAQGIYRCHSFVRDGKIEFLSDSTHGLRGMTVDLPNWPFLEESDLMISTTEDL